MIRLLVRSDAAPGVGSDTDAETWGQRRWSPSVDGSHTSWIPGGTVWARAPGQGDSTRDVAKTMTTIRGANERRAAVSCRRSVPPGTPYPRPYPAPALATVQLRRESARLRFAENDPPWT